MRESRSADDLSMVRDLALFERVLDAAKTRVEILDQAGPAIDDWISRRPAALRATASEAIAAARAGGRGHFVSDDDASDAAESWEISIERFADAADGSERLLVVSRDVTERDGARRALARSERRNERADRRSQNFVRLAEASGDYIIMAGLDRSIEYVNASLLRAMEVASVEEFVAAGRLAFFAPKERKTFEETIVPALQREGRWSGAMQFRSLKTQTMFPVAYHAFALRDEAGKAVGLASVSRDVGDRRRVEIGMRALAETGAAMYASLDVESTLRNVANAVVRTFASHCVVEALAADGTLRSIGASNRGPAFAHLIESAAQSRPRDLEDAAWRAVLRADSTLSVALPPDWLSLPGDVEGEAVAAGDFDVRSLLCVPIHSRQDGGIYGSLTCLLDDRDARANFIVDDLRFCEEIAVRAGLALDHARAYERERRIAVTLQEASLPRTLPAVDGIVLTADYRPGSSEATIGGDWYDAFTLDDGRVAMTIGDVVGHGLGAAVTMGKVRQAMQAAATIVADPNSMLDVADRVVRAESGDAYATALAGILDPREGTFTFASAGHPGPFVRSPGGEVADRTATTALLGMRGPDENAVRTIDVESGSMLFLFTDGLSEVARDVERGTKHIREAIADPAIASAASPARALVRHILGDAPASDDIAVLVAAVGLTARSDRPAGSTHERREHAEIAVSFAATSRPRSRAKVLAVPARLEEIAAVRRSVRTLLETSGERPEAVENAELVTGELVANAVAHGTGSKVEVSLWTGAGGIVLGVTNKGERFDLGRRDVGEMLLAERGRGLAILSALGCTLDVATTGECCTVTAVIPPSSPEPGGES